MSLVSTMIHVEGLGKKYLIGQRRAYRTLRESIMDKANFRRNSEGKVASFWALREVTFDAAPGDVIGVIGRNGAGKSTLLKIMSRITEPTLGRVDLYGRVGSLLEVGTGFHPELTGRENVYLNGAIIGMRRAEISRLFDEIVAFAEVDTFIDTPVKRYSSGMYLRLAFAVAAFLESEILLVDEVLAVGDASFQKKCLGKMRDISSSGRTILFVSHNMAALESLCNRVLYIKDGKTEAIGKPEEVIAKYLAGGTPPEAASRSLSDHPGRRGGAEKMMRCVTLLNGQQAPAACIRMGESLTVRLAFESRRSFRPIFGFVVRNCYGMPVFSVSNRVISQYQFTETVNSGSVSCTLEDLPLMPGTYSLDLHLGDEYQDFDVISDAASFEVNPADVFGSGKIPPACDGPVYWPAKWVMEPAEHPVAQRQ